MAPLPSLISVSIINGPRTVRAGFEPATSRLTAERSNQVELTNLVLTVGIEPTTTWLKATRSAAELGERRCIVLVGLQIRGAAPATLVY